MSWLDISSYIMENIGFTMIALVIGAIITGAPTGITADAARLENDKGYLFPLIGGLLVTIIMITLSMLPTHDRILAVKLSRIKNEMVNKQNLKKSLETIERIGEKLECKYLGCEKAKE